MNTINNNDNNDNNDNDNNKYIDLQEINDLRQSIQVLELENRQAEKLIANNNSKIKQAREKIANLHTLANQSTFEYMPLINDTIGGISIKKICVHGCNCLTTNHSICDGNHQISIYSNIDSNNRINFNNSKYFSIKELAILNYLSKLVVTVSDDYSNMLHKRCQLAKQFPSKIVVYGFF